MKFAWKNIALISAVALFALPVTAQDGSSATMPAASPTRTIVIHAKKFAFDPAEITLKKGETVKLELTSDDVEHSLVVPELGIKGTMKKGEMTDVVVTPRETGDFKGKCGKYCGIGHGKMHFVVHVVN